jgi:hypothetical protein
MLSSQRGQLYCGNHLFAGHGSPAPTEEGSWEPPVA